MSNEKMSFFSAAPKSARSLGDSREVGLEFGGRGVREVGPDRGDDVGTAMTPEDRDPPPAGDPDVALEVPDVGRGVERRELAGGLPRGRLAPDPEADPGGDDDEEVGVRRERERGLEVAPEAPEGAPEAPDPRGRFHDYPSRGTRREVRDFRRYGRGA